MDKKSLIAMGTGLALALAMSASYANPSNIQPAQIKSNQQVQKADGQCSAGTCEANKDTSKPDGSCDANMKADDGSCGANK